MRPPKKVLKPLLQTKRLGPTARLPSRFWRICQTIAHHPARVFLAFLVTAIGLASSGLKLIRRMTVDVGSTEVAINLLTAPFTIANTGNFALHDVRPGIVLCEINEPI
jgi:hypothetical protein